MRFSQDSVRALGQKWAAPRNLVRSLQSRNALGRDNENYIQCPRCADVEKQKETRPGSGGTLKKCPVCGQVIR